MRTSHRQIRKRILDAKSKITDEEFFSSRAYNGYLTDLAEAATKRYKRPLRVRVVADHDDETVAFTDYYGIYINACNHITWSFPSRLLRSMSLEGLNAHECGHNLFTDERIWHSYFAGLAKGKFYPKMPDGLDSMQKLYAKDTGSRAVHGSLYSRVRNHEGAAYKRPAPRREAGGAIGWISTSESIYSITFKDTMSSDCPLLFPSLSIRRIPATIGSSKSSSAA